MRTLLVVLAALVLPAWAQEVIARDTNGIVVEVKEKYGGFVVDTCSVVMLHEGNFVLIHKGKASSWYPTSFHSVRVVERLAEKQDAVRLAAVHAEKPEQAD